MKSSPTKGGFWERVQAWCDDRTRPATQAPPYRNPAGPVNTTEPGRPIPIGIRRADGTFFIGTSKDLPDPTLHYLPDGAVLDIDKMLEENTRLLEENQKLRKQVIHNGALRKQLRDAQHAESLLARRVEAFRQKWPAIHKQFFALERNDT